MNIENNVRDMGLYKSSTNIGQQSRSEVSAGIKSEPTTIKNQGQTKEQRAHEVDEHEVIQAIEKANKHFRTYDRKLEFSIHEVTKQIMVKVINTEDDSVIREIPSEKILDMVAHLWEAAGILVDEKR